MLFYNANVVDVLRLSQRDEAFLRDTEENLQAFIKLLGTRNFHKISKNVPLLANIWYYFITSVGNLQTLGEEYTGTMRLDANNKIPSKLLQLVWLILHIGGEPLLDRLLSSAKNKLVKSFTLTNEAKSILTQCVDFLIDEKPSLKRIHNSLFYIDGKHYNFSNRMVGFHYVLLREWQQQDYFVKSFSILGHVSLLYILYKFINKLLFDDRSKIYSEQCNSTNISKKDCILCGEFMKSPCATACGHIFCWECIYDSLNYQKVCPVCRENVNPSRIILLQNYS